MKIVRNTPNQLILQSVPWAFGIGLIAAILGVSAGSLAGFLTGNYLQGTVLLLSAAFLGLFFALFVRRDDLILERSWNLIELSHASLFGRHKVRHELQDLKEVIVQTQDSAPRGGSNSQYNGPTHRAVLVLDGGMDAGNHPVTENYAGGLGAKLAAEAINTWLALDVDVFEPPD